MTKARKNICVEIKIWYTTFIVFTAGFVLAAAITIFQDRAEDLPVVLLIGIGCFIASAVGSMPALIVLSIALPLIRKLVKRPLRRIYTLFFLTLIITTVYGFVFGLIMYNPLYGNSSIQNFLQAAGIASALLFIASATAVFINIKQVKEYFNHQTEIKINTMETNESEAAYQAAVIQKKDEKKNDVLVKALVVGGLILVMLIPMAFIQSLVTERKERQAEAIKEVSSKWAGPQTISNPYLVVPYNAEESIGNTGRNASVTKYLIVLPESNTVSAILNPEIRRRSIYNVPLYRSNINMSGYFDLSGIAKYVQPEKIYFNDIKICLGLSEFRSIEDGTGIGINNMKTTMTPGLPVNNIDSIGMSAPVIIDPAGANMKISYNTTLRIKGSSQLQFVPLSGSSNFLLKSAWPGPSFTGNQIPAQREVNDSGFTAAWNFNKANLPFDLVIKDKKISKADLAFGVSMVQPVDGYLQTIRCVKYAILIIGLSFAVFFITELMQKNPVHPVQYALVGLALSIYYTLLLSISEFTLFNIAYTIAASATVLLIAYYTKNHFKNLKTGFVFGGFLALLYGFIYVLIQLEDTALLAGSIALFFILATVMHITRKVNWYRL